MDLSSIHRMKYYFQNKMIKRFARNFWPKVLINRLSDSVPFLSRLLIIILLLFIHSVAIAQTSPDREFRASWLTTTWALDWPEIGASPETQRQDLIRILDRHVDQNLNAVVFQVSGRGDALYQSENLPWSYILTGNPNEDPGWDPLEFAIEEAHQRGLELHAWFNVFSIAYNSFSDSPANSDTPNVRFTHPEWIISITDDLDNEHIWLNPGIPEAREWLVRNVVELVELYDVDAVHFDRIRYFTNGYDGDSKLFAKHNPDNLTDIDDWRRYNITEFVREASNQIRELKPWVKIGAAVSAHYNRESSDGWAARYGYSDVFADSRSWVENGYLDYLSPMNYWNISSPPRFDFITANWANHAGDQYHIYMGTGPYKMSVLNELHKQIDVTRNHGIQGQLHYRYSNIEGIDDHYSSRYSQPSLIPSTPNRSQEQPPPIESIHLNLTGDSLSISWNSLLDPLNPYNRHKFAIYCSACGPNQTRELIAVTGKSELKMPAVYLSDGKQAEIAVTALSRNYVESEPVKQSIIITHRSNEQEIARKIKLHPNYPNPFNPSTQITFELPETAKVALTVYNVTGQRVAELVDEIRIAGSHQVVFDGSGLSSGVYFYRLKANGVLITQKMTLLK